MEQGPISERKGQTVCISEDARWGEAVFACLEKIVELMKAPDVTKESAEIAQILADTARQLESIG